MFNVKYTFFSMLYKPIFEVEKQNIHLLDKTVYKLVQLKYILKISNNF